MPQEKALVVGEIHTGLLNSSRALEPEISRRVLDLFPPHGVRTWERPVRQAASPELLAGVDCDLPTTGKAVRVIGTVASEVWLTAGHVLQADSRARIVSSPARRRLSWSHYLAHPGVVEAMSPPNPADVVPGFLSGARTRRVLDLAAVCNGLMDSVQRSPLLDRKAPFRQPRSRMRWSALTGPGHISFTLESDGLRTLRLAAPLELTPHLPELCRDLARHDWLLSAVVAMLDRAGPPLETLRPAVDHVLHAWMPGARLPDELLPYRDELDRRGGFTRQWVTALSRIRDQLALATVDHLAGRVIDLPAERTARVR